jgi:hypothetical protein
MVEKRQRKPKQFTGISTSRWSPIALANDVLFTALSTRLRDYFFIAPPGVVASPFFSADRGARALSACVFRGRRRAAGCCSCRTIFIALPPAEAVLPSLERQWLSCLLRDHQQRSFRLQCFRPLEQRRECWKIRTLSLVRLC